MNRNEAFEKMIQGHKITHQYFEPDEFYEMKNLKIIAEDGVAHAQIFWSKEDGNWRENGWEIYNSN